ncbi:hypothetical protein [Arenibaculum sp.]|uniref:pPIWI-associating nuclease domain-containing protein n=1 Tax=Arenibaculum sp. TaxID=2865862 RepID=UPI002E11DF4B|nr:hypothetical protein [Arenibaculum sp.]
MAVAHKQRELTDDDRHRIATALTADVIAGSNAWKALGDLSEETVIDEVEVFESEIDGRRSKAEGIFNVYVELEYGRGDDDGFQSSDAYPGRFVAHIEDDGRVVFDSISVDVSSFYA